MGDDTRRQLYEGRVLMSFESMFDNMHSKNVLSYVGYMQETLVGGR